MSTKSIFTFAVEVRGITLNSVLSPVTLHLIFQPTTGGDLVEGDDEPSGEEVTQSDANDASFPTLSKQVIGEEYCVGSD